MLIKISGLILAFVFFSSIGFYQSYKLKKRKDNLCTILLFLNRMCTSIQYRNDDLFLLVSKCCDDILTPLKEVKSDTSEYSQKISALPLNKEDKTLLEKFFSGLGTSDIDGQIRHISLYTNFFNELYEKSKTDIEKKSKLYTLSGVFAGLTFVVMFI
ncbi:MAG: stage III sporulation protein AB [Oscillospiraceae bacterium]|nr:stage III sporulation protein AB [Oscillospiraceae bacterium]